jgi:hypothetical protein
MANLNVNVVARVTGDGEKRRWVGVRRVDNFSLPRTQGNSEGPDEVLQGLVAQPCGCDHLGQPSQLVISLTLTLCTGGSSVGYRLRLLALLLSALGFLVLLNVGFSAVSTLSQLDTVEATRDQRQRPLDILQALFPGLVTR